MSKFKMRLVVTGLELEIEGAREDVPEIARGVNQQLTGLIAPVARIAAESEEVAAYGRESTPVHAVETESVGNGKSRGRKRRTPAPAKQSANGNDGSIPEVVDWRHDAARWG